LDWDRLADVQTLPCAFPWRHCLDDWLLRRPYRELDSVYETHFAKAKGSVSFWRMKAIGGDPQRLAAVGDDAYVPVIATHGHRLIYCHGSAKWSIFAQINRLTPGSFSL
jgi:hypothetical protein